MQRKPGRQQREIEDEFEQPAGDVGNRGQPRPEQLGGQQPQGANEEKAKHEGDLADRERVSVPAELKMDDEELGEIEHHGERATTGLENAASMPDEVGNAEEVEGTRQSR